MNGTAPVLVLGWPRQGRIEGGTLKLLGEARRIASCIIPARTVEVALFVSPDDSEQALKDLGHVLGERIHLVVHSALSSYGTEPWLEALTELFLHVRPGILLIGATSEGRDLAPRHDSEWGTGLIVSPLEKPEREALRSSVFRIGDGFMCSQRSPWSDRCSLQ